MPQRCNSWERQYREEGWLSTHSVLLGLANHALFNIAQHCTQIDDTFPWLREAINISDRIMGSGWGGADHAFIAWILTSDGGWLRLEVELLISIWWNGNNFVLVSKCNPKYVNGLKNLDWGPEANFKSLYPNHSNKSVIFAVLGFLPIVHSETSGKIWKDFDLFPGQL